MNKFETSLYVVIWCYTISFSGCSYAFERNENRMIRQLLKNYDPDARPVRNQSEPIKVFLKLTYRELKEMDEPKQAMSSITWFQIRWKDASLNWNKEEYGGISSIRLDPSRVWKPDLTLYNSVNEKGGDLYSFITKPIISSDGSVRWLTPAILKSTCKLAITNFPFDEQKCTLKIGSWTYSSYELDLNFSGNSVNLESYNENTEWQLLEATMIRNTKVYPCCLEPYQDLTYTFHFRRKPWYYIISVVFPCVILSLLATISFLFPAESGERVSLVISVLLGLTVFMLIINNKTPVTSDTTPMITRYFSGICCMTLAILMTTAYLLRVHHASCSAPVPYYVASVRDFFAFFLFMTTSLHQGATRRGSNLIKIMSLGDDRRLSALCDCLPPSKQTHTADKILHELQKFSTWLEDETLSKEMKEDWQYTARVFNRLFFCIFIMVFLSLNLYVFSFLFT